MIRLKSFGHIDLRGAGGELRGILTQPKRLALLLRLAAERPGTFLRRDTLLAMFWPELDTAGARNALRQALFHLRRELGDGVLVNRGDEEVGLNTKLIWSDIGEFEASAEAGRWDAALDLIGGDLAPGLYLSDAPGFEEWLEATRADIHRRAAAGAWERAREAGVAGNPGLAAAWARRAMRHAPEDEAGVRRLLAFLIQSGDTAGAAHVYVVFAERLRREYGVSPAPETTAIWEALPAEPPGIATPAPPFPQAPGRVSIPPGSDAAGPIAPPPSRSWRWGAAAGLCFLFVTGLIGWWRARDPLTTPTAEARLLIAPFRTGGSDTMLAALSVGLVDLTNARLSGASSPHPVDPDVALRAVGQAKRHDSTSATGPLLEAARQTGAGLVLTGTIIREGSRIALAAVVLRAPDGSSVQLPTVSGPVDSLPWMVDRMAVDLLSALASQDGADAPSLSSIPLPALRAYLDGREAMREGRVTSAIAALARALELDSTFALAARDYAEAVDWVGEDPQGTAKNRAWALRDRLGVRDRAFLTALVGRRWPAPTPVREQVEDWEAAIRWAPDRSRAWFGLGDALFHSGNSVGIAGAQGRARNAFDRALALDSASAPALLHRIEVAAREGDTATVRRLMPLVERSGETSDALEFLRWRTAVALGDSAAVLRARSAFDSFSPFALVRIVGWGQLDHVGMGDPVRALAVLQRRASTSAEAAYLYSLTASQAGNRGRVAQLARVAVEAGGPASITAPLMYAADEAARPAMEALRRAVREGRDSSPESREALTFWQLWEGDSVDGAAARAYLAALDRRPDLLGSAAPACLAAARLGVADAAARLRRADSLVDWLADANQVGATLLILARCHEAAGDQAGALDMLGRRPLDPVYGPNSLAGYLYDEGRVALRMGDRPRALRAWRHFLMLRDDPDPALRPQVAAVRRVVDSLSRN
ncbi:MAG TPA: BTAD domain-containing putative transcriptional regulator [Gemmatimonadales bacterium]|nr:BTAD domain-containing putative transcriptional regulator [Gemmatimonadales bacterium]